MSTSMRAIAVLPGRREVTLLRAPEPRIGSPTEVRIRILDVGVCGTDKEICAFEYGIPPKGSEHLVIGHESLGEVVEVGSAVSKVKAGDLVVVMVRRPCDREECVPCRAGRPDFCSTGEHVERGINGIHGFMTEYVVDDEKWLVPVPKALRDVAVLVEPLTIAEKALDPGARDPGAAAVGRAPPARRAGATAPWCWARGRWACSARWRSCATASGPSSTRARRKAAQKDALVRSFGASYISTEATPPSKLAERIGGIDLVYEAVGLSRLAFDVMAEMDRNGIFVFTGVAALKGPQPLDTDTLMRNLVLKNQVALGTVNAGRDAFEAAVAISGSSSSAGRRRSGR